ncbi:hypothetical protein L1987_74454 [Smallanthus sonchifolius]|uniref:Uncharacterized protein n=1 Tax=Smallanthus sonchifolius TaxID=185202 RepID=A0ACB9A4B3_9ASTR|nr:hypothetical protein L1987_74454 [Smallanthus sonchifolius]
MVIERRTKRHKYYVFHKVRRLANPIDRITKTLTNLHRRCVYPQFSSFRFRTSGGNWNSKCLLLGQSQRKK